MENLRAKGHESPYLDRLCSRLPSYQSQGDLAAEIVREMAAALGRSEDKVNAALLELDVQGRAIDALIEGGGARSRAEIAERVAAWNKRREVAVQALWELRVHREAIGFLRNDDLTEYYPIPPKRTPPGG